MLDFLSNSTKVTIVSAPVVAGTSDVECSSVDMAGYEYVSFLAAFGTITTNAVTSVKIQQSSDDGVADGWSDLEGTGLTVADSYDSKCVMAEVRRPTKRYVRCVVDRGTQNAVVDLVLAFQYGATESPATQPASVAADEQNVSPAEGTA